MISKPVLLAVVAAVPLVGSAAWVMRNANVTITEVPRTHAEGTLPPSAPNSPVCQLRLITEQAAIRRGDPGLLVGPPRVKVTGCPANPIQVRLFSDVLDHEAILKKEGEHIRVFPVPPLADRDFRVRVIRVKLEAECLQHRGSHAQGIWEIRVYPSNAVLDPPAVPGDVKAPGTMTPTLGDQPNPVPQQPLPSRAAPGTSATPSGPLPPGSATGTTSGSTPAATPDPPEATSSAPPEPGSSSAPAPAVGGPGAQPVSPAVPPAAAMVEVELPKPNTWVWGGELLTVQAQVTPPGGTLAQMILLDEVGKLLTQVSCRIGPDGKVMGTLRLPRPLPPLCFLEVRVGTVEELRSGAAVTHRLPLRGR